MKISRFLVVGCIVIYALLFGLSIGSSTISVMDNSFSKTSNISIEPISYDITYVYNDDVIYGKESVISSGSVGYMLTDSKSIIVSPTNRVIEVGRGALSIDYGSTTGYGADCAGCSGNVACSTPSGGYNLIRDGIFYNDSKYGSVRVVAADNSKFSCGTIMEIDNGIMKPFMAIVLDTGGAMRNAYSNGNILIDIAFPYESSSGIHSATNRSGDVKFKVYRYGW